MAYLYALDATIPAGSEAIALGDDRIREFKNAISERVNSRFVDVNADPWILKSPASGGNVQSLIPTADNTYALGTGALRYSALFAGTGTFHGGSVAIAGGVNPFVSLNDGTRVAYFQIAGGVARLDHNGSVRLSMPSAGHVGVPATTHFFLDGGDNTYIYESVADQIDLVVGGVARMQLGASVVIPAGTRIYVDGGGDTYIRERLANILTLTAGNADALEIVATGVWIGSTSKFWLDGGGDSYLQEGPANTINIVAGGSTNIQVSATRVALGVEVTLPATARLYLDGGGDTYLYEASANLVQVYTGGVMSLDIRATQVSLPGDFILGATKKLYLDGGGDTYILESAPNLLEVYVGGSSRLAIGSAVVVNTGTDLVVSALRKLFLDGGGDTYIHEAAANRMVLVAGANEILRVEPGGAGLPIAGIFLYIQATSKFYLDGGGDTYIHESSANVLNFVSGGVSKLITVSDGFSVGAATQRVYLDGGADTYVYESSANILTFVTGGTAAAIIGLTDFNITNVSNFLANTVKISAASKLYLDGGGDTYIDEVSANVIRHVVGGSEIMRWTATGTVLGAGGAEVKKWLTASPTWDPGIIAAQGAATTTVTVTGAAVGDQVLVGNEFGGNTALSGRVTSADTVTLTLYNGATLGLDPPSTVLRVFVLKF